MANITAAMVKELRESTGAGMMDCKQALTESDGDMEAAVDWLRKKGLSKAAKKSGRVAAEGLVAVSTDAGKGAVVEVNSETDFVARNESFQKMVGEIAKLALSVDGDIEKLKAADFPGAGKSVQDHVTEMVGTIGENMTLRRSAALSVNPGVVAAYVHNAATDGAGRIGVLVALKSEADAAALNDLGRQIAMHVAATAPLARTTEELDQATIERERAVFADQAKASGKPDNIIEKMVEGRLRKFYEEVVLLKQGFVMDPDSTVEKVLEAKGKELGSPITLEGFVRFNIGEGIEKEESDFAAEVAAAAKG